MIKITAITLKFIFLVLIILVGVNIYGIYVVREQVKNEIKETNQKIIEYTEKKERVQRDIKKFDEKEKVEKIARNQLNLKKEGETIYKIVD